MWELSEVGIWELVRDFGEISLVAASCGLNIGKGLDRVGEHGGGTGRG